MTITFDQFLQCICHTREVEAGYEIQGDVHGSASIMYEWKAGNLGNNDVVTIMNFDNTDPELTTVKIHLNGLTNAETLALQSAMDLAQKEITGYDKALLRMRFGL